MKRILLSLMAFLPLFSLTAQNSASLRLNLEKGKLYRMKAQSEQTVTQTINGNQQSVDSKVNYILSMKMLDATPAFIIAEVHFDTLVTTTNSMGKIVNITSAREGDIKATEVGDIVSCIMNRLSKNPAYVKLDFTGKPLEIVNAKMLSDMILKDTSSITLTGVMRNAVKTQLVSAVSENTLKTMIGMFTWSLPGKDISAGESWKAFQQTNSGGMSLDINTSYHLDGINGNMASITAEASIKPPENALPMEQAGAKITYDNLQGLSKTTLVIDTRTGLTTKSESKTHIAGTLGISAPGFSMQMPMDINGESKISLLQ